MEIELFGLRWSHLDGNGVIWIWIWMEIESFGWRLIPCFSSRFSPDQALDEFEKGTIWLAPPTWHNLKMLARFSNLEQIMNYSRTRLFGTHVQPILPVFGLSASSPIDVPPDRTFVTTIHLNGNQKKKDCFDG